MLKIEETRISQVVRSGQPYTQVVMRCKYGDTRISAHGLGQSFAEARESAIASLNDKLAELEGKSFEEYVAESRERVRTKKE